jgi:hypothetical protein
MEAKAKSFILLSFNFLNFCIQVNTPKRGVEKLITVIVSGRGVRRLHYLHFCSFIVLYHEHILPVSK